MTWSKLGENVLRFSREVRFCHDIDVTKQFSPNTSSSALLALCTSLSSNVIHKLPRSDSSSRSSVNLGHIMHSHLSWRSMSSALTGFDVSHSRMMGELTLSL